ncbi:putative viral a-type inclusion protein repeat domain-containing protein [Golovinomyces cichoracearum]|uniref:Putative viral a-type inclusion protein repeat domain-containing protein n=1 Tax=Golovinomyces cichoracearum TaxID=62708 RepID=A0A420IFK3_9PEZI|nr:putative viral a-type inclusion protein repeat domain-containing protein [Golovinomyces cichoracearum]
MSRTMPQSQPENERTDLHSETENTATQMDSEVDLEIEKEKETPENSSKETSNDVKKEKDRDYLKRSTVLKRTSNSTTGPGTKVTNSVTRNTVLTKPPTKQNSVVPSTRKSVSSSGLGHTRSAHSSGGSGDEQRRALAAAARRASLTQASNHQPVKIETLAEKRGITGGNTRKPTSLVNSTNIKPIVKSTSATSKNGSSLKGKINVTTKQTTPEATTEAKKRLSNISGSTSTTKSTVRSSTIFSKEIDELKVKLAGNEILIEEQKNEIKASKERTEKLSKHLAEETNKLILLEKEVRKENTAKVDKLQVEHGIELQKLQAELEEVKSRSAIDQESLSKSIVDARRKEALENATVIQKIKEDFELKISSLNSELNSVKEKHVADTSKLSEKENEIMMLEVQLKNARDYQEESELKHQSTTNTLRQSLLDEHEASLCALKLEYEEKISKTIEEIESTHQQKIIVFSKDHDSRISELQKELGKYEAKIAEEANIKQILETRVDEFSKMISIKQSEIDSLKNKAEQDSMLLTKLSHNVKELNEKYESSQEKNMHYKNEITNTAEKLKSLKEECLTKSQDLIILRDELEQAKAQLTAQNQMKLILDADEKSKDISFKKLNADLEATKKKLSEKRHEIDLLREKQCQEISEITSNYQMSTKIKYDESVNNHENTLASHKKELDKLEKNHCEKIKLLEDKNMELKKKIKNLELNSQKTGKTVDEEKSHDPSLANTVELEGLKASYEEAISTLKEAHKKESLEISLSNEELKSVNEILKNQLIKLKANLDQAQERLEITHQNLERDKEISNLALAKLDIAKTNSENLDNKLASKNSREEIKENGIETNVENTQICPSTGENSTQNIKGADSKIIDIGHQLREHEAPLGTKDIETIQVNTESISDSVITSRNLIENLTKPDETKGEPDDSSAALASVRKPISFFYPTSPIAQARIVAEQISQMNDDLRNENFRSIFSLTEASPKIS